MSYQPTNWEHGDIITGGKLNKIEQELTHVADNATYGFGGAQLSSDGLTPLSYINAGDPMPANPQKGDTVFLKDGNDFLIYSYNGEDWVLKVDPDLSNRIEETIKTASDNTDKAIADNNTQINETINQVAKEQADLAVKDGDFNNKAQAMADKALSDAKDNTATVAKSTLDTANQNLNDAKASLTNAYVSADGVINKKIDDTSTSISSTISQNKKDAEGKITSAQTTATQALSGLSSKVERSEYNQKTGDLSTSVSKAQQTADSAVTTIGNYKTSNDNRVKATETSIAQNTKDITLRATSTDLDSAKKDYNAQIAQVKVNADSITNQVSSINSKVNDLSQVNLINNSDFRPDLAGWNGLNSTLGTLTTGDYDYAGNAVAVLTSTSTNMARVYSAPIPIKGLTTISYSWMYYLFATPSSASVNFQITYLDANMAQVAWTDVKNVVSTGTGKWTNVTVNGTVLKTYANAKYIAFTMDVRGNSGIKVGLSKPILVSGSTVGDYVPGQYNNNTAIAAQQVTINGITDTVSKQGTNIDSVTKRVTTAEGTLSTATNNISGLQTSVTQTANQITQEITDRTNGDSNTLQSSKDFTTSSITSYDKGVQTQLTQTSDAILAKVGAANLFPNSEFTQAYGYTASGTVVRSGSVKNNIDNKYNGTVSVTSTSAGYQGYWTEMIPVYGGKKYSASVLVHYTNGGLSNGSAMLDIWFYDKDNKRISSGSRATGQVSSPYWVKLSNEGFTAPINAVKVQVSLLVNNAGAGQVATFTQPIVTATEKLQEYTPNDDVSSQLSLLKNNWSIGITDNISKITSGIVGNASQMSLISKNVTIDSPNTQIKGTAWIQSAMIANGAIGSAQIGDATITSAKIATLDVAKLTGNVSNFIQSNWNGLYQSVKISPIGMTISTSQGSTAQFNQDGLVLDGALGTTNVLNGQIELISSKNEYLGTFQHETMPDHDNVDYLMIKLAGWHTSKPGDSDYDLNSDSSNTIRGGDGIGFGVTNSVGTYDMKMSWDSSLVAGYKGRKAGWHVEDTMTWHQPTYFEGGFDVAQQFSSTDRRALHIQGATLSNGHKWFGFFDTLSQAGFGTDDTNDVLFYVKGKSYSLYTMLNKLSML
ncbi:hypothetical protein [Leuconostoc suionicum]|uniref:hypothetical protein n=1 Tax=Leuconostoc suionicum TaxID=1511761 RepID=UPI0032DFA041